MKTVLSRIYPIFFILGVWFAFSYPFFLKHRIPFPSTYQVNHFAPWNSYQKNWGPVKNNAIPDVISQMYPWKYLTIQIEKSGNLPLWNPYNFSGTPLMANFQSAAFSPFNLLFFVLSFIEAWSLLILLQPLLAGIFTYIFARELDLGKTSSLVASVAFMFCGFMTVWMPYGTLAMAAVFLPLALFSIAKVFKSHSALYLILLAVSICFSLFSGHFQTSLYVLIFSFLFILYNWYLSGNNRTGMYVLLAWIFGILLAMPQILPSIEFYFYAPRSEGVIYGGGIPFYYLVTLFAPDFFGNPVTRNDVLGNYAEWASFIGTVPLVMAMFGLTLRKKKSFAQYFTFATILFLILAVASPLQNVISYLKLPIFSTSNPSRVIILVSFSLSILAGFGMQRLHMLMEQKKIKQILVPFAILFMLLVAELGIMKEVHPVSLQAYSVALHNSILPLMLITVSLIAVLVVTFARKKHMFKFVLIFLLILASVDSLRFAQKWMPFDPENLLYQKTQVIPEIKKLSGNNRIYGDLGMETVDYYGLRSVEGYDPLFSTKYGDFITSASSGKLMHPIRSVVQLDKLGTYTDRVLNLLGVTVFFEPRGDIGQGWAYPVWSKPQFSQVYQDDHFDLFFNKLALARPSMFSSYKVFPENKILNKFYSKDFNYRQVLLLNKKPEITIDQKAKGSATIVSSSSNTYVIKTRTTGNSLLFLSDSFFPGWEAYIDGKVVKILRADYTFDAIPLPKGTHQVVFSYQPVSFVYGVILAAAGLVLLLFSVLLMHKRT